MTTCRGVWPLAEKNQPQLALVSESPWQEGAGVRKMYRWWWRWKSRLCMAVHMVGLGTLLLLVALSLAAAVFFGKEQWAQAVDVFHPWWAIAPGVVLAYLPFLVLRLWFTLDDFGDSIHILGWDYHRRQKAQQEKDKRKNDQIFIQLLSLEVTVTIESNTTRDEVTGDLVKAILEWLLTSAQLQLMDWDAVNESLICGKIEDARAAKRDVISIRPKYPMILAIQNAARVRHILFGQGEDRIIFDRRKHTGSMTGVGGGMLSGNNGSARSASVSAPLDPEATWKGDLDGKAPVRR